jgi:hypothetical protein
MLRKITQISNNLIDKHEKEYNGKPVDLQLPDE